MFAEVDTPSPLARWTGNSNLRGLFVAYWALLGVPGAFPGVPFSPACCLPGSSAVASVEALLSTLLRQ